LVRRLRFTLMENNFLMRLFLMIKITSKVLSSLKMSQKL